MKKFELTTEFTKEFFGKTLFRIRALVSFGEITEGEIGGWVEKEDNLDQDGNAWVYGNALVSGDAWVSGDAQVYGNAQVSGDAWVYGDAQVYGNAQVYGDARVSGDAWVYGDAHLITMSPIGSEGGCLTAFRQKDNSIMVRRGCFSGTIDEFAAAAAESHGETRYAKEYGIVIELIKARLDEVVIDEGEK